MYLVILITTKDHDFGGKDLYNFLHLINREALQSYRKKIYSTLLDDCPLFEYEALYKKRLADFACGYFEFVVISEKAKRFMESFFVSREIRFFPVHIVYKKTREDFPTTHYLMNFPNTIDCIDEERSILTTPKRSSTNLAYFEKIATIANLQEDMVWDKQFGGILVSEKFVNEYKKNGLSGMTFVDIDKYNKPAGYAFFKAGDRKLAEWREKQKNKNSL